MDPCQWILHYPTYSPISILIKQEQNREQNTSIYLKKQGTNWVKHSQ